MNLERNLKMTCIVFMIGKSFEERRQSNNKVKYKKTKLGKFHGKQL